MKLKHINISHTKADDETEFYIDKKNIIATTTGFNDYCEWITIWYIEG